jgi:hypothetical protein
VGVPVLRPCVSTLQRPNALLLTLRRVRGGSSGCAAAAAAAPRARGQHGAHAAAPAGRVPAGVLAARLVAHEQVNQVHLGGGWGGGGVGVQVEGLGEAQTGQGSGRAGARRGPAAAQAGPRAALQRGVCAGEPTEEGSRTRAHTWRCSSTLARSFSACSAPLVACGAREQHMLARCMRRRATNPGSKPCPQRRRGGAAWPQFLA